MKTSKRSVEKTIKNILIVNVHSSQNAGDYALLIQTIHYLKETFGDIKISVMANWPNESALEYACDKVIAAPWWLIGVWDKNKKPRFQVLSLVVSFLYLFLYRADIFSIWKKFLPESWRKVFDAYIKTDLVVAVSGNQLFSSGRLGWPLPVLGYPIFLGLCFNKQIIIFPQSIGPLKTKVERLIVKLLYDRVDKLFVRDLESMRLVEKLKIKNSLPEFMHDVAFTLLPTSESLARKRLINAGFIESKDNIGITVISSMSSYLSSEIIQNYYQSLARTIERLVNQPNFEIFLFCQVFGPHKDENDAIAIERVIKEIKEPVSNKIHIINEKIHPSELKACYGLMDAFIASRLHSGIFALGMNVPTLFIGYLYKTMGVLKAINLDEFQIDLKDVTENNIHQKFMNLWTEKSSIRKKIRDEISTIEKELGNLPSEIGKVIS